MQKPKYLVIDVDGVLTTGHMIYSKEGKQYKMFGPDDIDAIRWLKERVDIEVIIVSADYRGFDISKKRAEEMGLRIEFVPSKERWKHLEDKLKLNLSEVIYIGDGFYDSETFTHVFFSICPNDGFFATKLSANHVTEHNGGNRCVAEACLYIYRTFFKDEN